MDTGGSDARSGPNRLSGSGRSARSSAEDALDTWRAAQLVHDDADAGVRVHSHSTPTGWRTVPGRHPVTTFFVIAYAVSWLAQFVIIGVLGLSAALAVPVITLGPTVAAVVMTTVLEGRAGLGRLGARIRLWRVARRWYAFALLGIPLAYLVGTILLPGALASYVPPDSLVRLVVTGAVILVLGGIIGGPLFEEPGWRGFALPRLQAQLGPLGASLLLGLVWAGWHFPQFLMPEWATQNGGLSPTTISVFVATVVSISVILTWLFNHTHASVFLAILAHSAVNTSQAVLNPLFPAVDTDLNGLIGFGLLAVLLLVATRGRLGRPLPEMPGPIGGLVPQT